MACSQADVMGLLPVKTCTGAPGGKNGLQILYQVCCILTGFY